MPTNARLLVIGPTALGEAVGRALPRCQIVRREHALAGAWQLGQQPFDGVLLSLSIGKEALRALCALREIDPSARIVVTCSPADEPAARQAVGEGADEYVLEPLIPADLERCFNTIETRQPRPQPPSPPVTPSLDDITGLSEILKSLADGPQATLERFASLLRQTFQAAGVSIALDDVSASVGDVGEPALEADILRQDTPVGSIALARRERAEYDANDGTKLAEHARLIEATVAQARERNRWQNLAWTDDLSGLRNRRYFETTLADLVRQAAERRLRLTVLLFDIDDFKTYNDRYGHDTGDSLIREVGTLLTHCSRENDVVARFGGDEFVVILWDAEKPRIPGSKHPTEPIALAERFRRAIRDHAFTCLGSDAPGPVTISGGLASFPWDGSTPKELLKAADEALLAAKRTGKNRIELADTTPNTQE